MMKTIGVLTHRPLVLPLAVVVAVAMVTISEVTYWQIMGSLEGDALESLLKDSAAMAQHRMDLARSLMLARVDVVVLSLISVAALFLLLRQGLTLQRAAQAQAETLEATVTLRTGELRELTQHLQAAREDERSCLARDLHDELGALLTAAELMIYRLVQEAVNNISKHARARQVWLSLQLLTSDGIAQHQRVCLAVRDDGVGFDNRLPPSASHGLLGMRYRVQAESGGLQLATAPGQGTRIEVLLPPSFAAAPNAAA